MIPTSWFKVDDKLHSHPKWLDLSKSARALWVTAGSWAADQCTDGLVPRHLLARLDGKVSDAADLVRVGLWEVCDGGWIFHDWATYQPDAASEMVRKDAGRKAMSDAGGMGNHLRWHEARNLIVPTCSHCVPDDVPESGAIRVLSPRPVPTRTPYMARSALGFMAEPVSNRRSADARVGDDLDLTIHEGEAR